MKFSWNQLLNGLLLALLVGVGTYAYAATEKVKELETKVAVIEEKQSRSAEDTREIKQDVKEIKLEQSKANDEMKGLLKEVLAEAKKKK
jgi:hypothetical protein